MRNLKVLIDDGREFSLRAASYRHRLSSDLGSGYAFYGDDERLVCFVPTNRMVAIVEEESIARRLEPVDRKPPHRGRTNGRSKSPRRMSVA
jgi:hypothetical protein